MDGSVEIDPNGSPVLDKLWGAVGKVMSYTSRLIETLFNIVGVTAEEQSPFCRIFSCKLIEYLPRTFPFGDAGGTTEPSYTNDEAWDAPAASPEAIVLGRVRMFAGEMRRDDANRNKYSDSDDIEVVSNCDDIQVVSPSPISNTMSVSSEKLMTKFRKLVSSSMDELLDNVVHESSCLEGKYRGSLKGAVSSVRKERSLVGRWLDKPSGAASTSSPSPVDNPIEK